MRRARRDSTEILLDTLRAVSQTTRRTEIAKIARLGGERTDIYLGGLRRLGFVDEERIGNRRFYFLTQPLKQL